MYSLVGSRYHNSLLHPQHDHTTGICTCPSPTWEAVIQTSVEVQFKDPVGPTNVPARQEEIHALQDEMAREAGPHHGNHLWASFMHGQQSTEVKPRVASFHACFPKGTQLPWEPRKSGKVWHMRTTYDFLFFFVYSISSAVSEAA